VVQERSHPSDMDPVSDSFHLGEPARRPRGGFTVSATAIAVAALVVALVSVAAAFLLLAKQGGEDIAQAEASVVVAADVASDRAAQASVRNAAAAVRTAYIDTGSYEGLTPEAIAQIEPSLSFTAGPSTGDTTVSLAFVDQEAGIAAQSTTGTCFWWHDDAGQQLFGSGTPCTGQAAFGAAGASW
jgi:hypothetical protein